MATNDIYISHIVSTGNCRSTAIDLANAIHNEIIRKKLQLGELRFVLVPPTTNPYSTAFISFYDRELHFEAVNLLDKMSFRGQPTVWRLGKNEPLSLSVPYGAQYNADKKVRSERYQPYQRPASRRVIDSTRPGTSATQIQPKEEPQSREPSPPRRFTALEDTVHILELNQQTTNNRLRLICEKIDAQRDLEQQRLDIEQQRIELEQQRIELERQRTELERDQHLLGRATEFAERYPTFGEYLEADSNDISPSQARHELATATPYRPSLDYYK